jgi:hypothetical protein
LSYLRAGVAGKNYRGGTAMLSLTYEEFPIDDKSLAELKMEVDYDWEEYNPGNWRDEPPSGGHPGGFTLKVKSAKVFDAEGNETVATPETLVKLQALAEASDDLTEWINEAIIKDYGDGPEPDWDLAWKDRE